MVQSAACFIIYREKGLVEKHGEVDLRVIQDCIKNYVPKSKEKIKLACNDVDISSRIFSKSKRNQISGRIEKVKVKDETFRGHSYKIPVPYFIDFDFIQKRHLYLVIYAGRKIADEIAEEFKNITLRAPGVNIERKPLDDSMIRDLYDNVDGDRVSALGTETSGPPASKDIQYKNYIALSPPSEESPPVVTIFYIMFISGKYSDLRISVTKDSQITFYYKEITTKKGKKITINKNFAKLFSKKEVLLP